MRSKFIVLGLLFLFGCRYGEEVRIDTTPISSTIYPATKNPVLVYFNDNNIKITEPYEQLAFIEVKGQINSAASELIFQMKERAQGFGADAVINVTQQYYDREHGNILDDVVSKEHKPAETYRAILLSGIAIRFKKNHGTP